MRRIPPRLCAPFLGLVVLLPALAVRAQEVQIEIAQPSRAFLNG
jgi:hypothetical protein